MADDVTLPGTGAVIATDDVGGRQFQVIKPAFGADGSATLVSPAAPLPVDVYGELLEAVEAMRMALQSLLRMQGSPDVAQRLRVNVETGSVAVSSLPTLASVTTVTTVTTLTNQTNIGGHPATEQIPTFSRLGADALRRNIVVT